MRPLLQSLHDHDLGHLQIVAEFWGVELASGKVREAAPELAALMCDSALAGEVIASLPPDATIIDIVAKDTLLEALRRFPGTVIIVSHDRYILNELVTEVIEVGRGHAIRHLGNYDDYLSKKEQPAPAATPVPAKVAAPIQREARSQARYGNGKQITQDRELQRHRERVARRRAQLEAGIETKEAERAALATEMNDPNFYLARKDANQLIARYESLGREIEHLYNELVQQDDSAPAGD